MTTWNTRGQYAAPRPPNIARGVACALLAVALSWLWAGAWRYNHPPGAIQGPAVAVSPAGTSFPASPAAEIPHFVDPTTGLNAQTRIAADEFRKYRYTTVINRLRDALGKYRGASSAARQSSLNYLGASLKIEGRPSEADEALRQAINLAPETEEARQAIKWLQKKTSEIHFSLQ